MKKNAFTLIELLAVIVILAIIALIATPIILGIINDSKEQANERSAENYIDAVEQAIVRKNMKGVFRPTKCDIVDGEVTCEGYIEPLDVEIDGEVPQDGTIIINNGSVVIGTELIFKEFKATINEEGNLVTNKKEVPKDDTIEEGPEHLAKDNVKAVTTPTTGIVPTIENGNLKPGSEFQIKVNNTSDWLTFFVLSNDGNHVNLIAEQNISKDGIFIEDPQNTEVSQWYVTSSNSYNNRYGPQTAYTYLSIATNNWTNIPIIEKFDYLDEGNQSNLKYGYQSIITSLDSSTGKYITTITPLSSNYGNPVTYENIRARLPKYSEITSTEAGCTLDDGECPLWVVNYLISDITGDECGYWLNSSDPDNGNRASAVYCYGLDLDRTDSVQKGIRPVITILKSDLLRIMQ